MNIIDLNKNDILKHSIKDDDFYRFTIGSPIQVTCLNNANVNKLISKNLSSDVLEDKFMLRYTPNNKILFNKDIVDKEEEFVSLSINRDTNEVIVGAKHEYSLTDGILVFSGFLSANNMVENDRYIFGNSRVLESIKKRVMVLSIGVRKDMLYALYYIPSGKGLAFAEKRGSNIGISVNTLKECDCSEYERFTIKDWFDGAKIVEI